tara:strand:+ start:127 stop:390 length:264 start_codon:yes stop_codon:yes gene_type:complete
MNKLTINKTERFLTSKELRIQVAEIMFTNNIKKTEIASAFKLKKITGSTYPTILKKLDNPSEMKYSEILLLCNVLQCDLKELIIKNK